MNRKIRSTLKIMSNTLVIAVVLFAFLLHGFRFFGLTPYSVLSGSMESIYPTGSLIYVKAVEPEKLKVDDIITFKTQGGIVATHRIIELVPDKNNSDVMRFRTKGDENEIADGSLVDIGSVIGKPVFGIPLIGYLATYINYPPGKYVAITVAVALILLEIIISILLSDKKDDKTIQN